MVFCWRFLVIPNSIISLAWSLIIQNQQRVSRIISCYWNPLLHSITWLFLSQNSSSSSKSCWKWFLCSCASFWSSDSIHLSSKAEFQSYLFSSFSLLYFRPFECLLPHCGTDRHRYHQESLTYESELFSSLMNSSLSSCFYSLQIILLQLIY